MAEYQYTYAIRSEGQPLADQKFAFTSQWGRDNGRRSTVPPWHFVVRDAARNVHCEHDGPERDWPLTFEIWDRVGTSLGMFKVDRIVHEVDFEVTDA